MFQFAKFSKSKERRLATELGYGFPIGDPWITDGISPWPFASESVLPSQCPGIHPMHSFRSCTQGTLNTTKISMKLTISDCGFEPLTEGFTVLHSTRATTCYHFLFNS
ncbi:hypothetical protein ISN45_Un97g000450 (mitochondrion) [Arabidopsis thaliana x Arabidopsis arenosa]|uniref:Uncharacterized mitochondrial protein AtMg00030 n=4 Tax=Brassicaceae TaxID=3700 RepID=M030_ARATH|nr:RecName: Full=Uncharacterized mitochondrial protein AtMg00030; AltName: Full=ORF107a [Arabidopsis thaliana]KAG7529261.1 hypothetical protein ISN45_Un97g000450 [Arabidopsis thaliana x Arabidopsis arenosa]KAG7529333.1 hypothetical protein ISN44_Un143g000190 [Arabidopsis suecica]CAA69780.1 unnamed protein product [Arabidopsis thaliana]